jgi:hypothetical protein
LKKALDQEVGTPGLAALVQQRCPFLFSAVPVFVAAPQLLKMAQVVQAIESVVAMPAYREQVLATAPPIARLGTRGPLSVFFGYDFHLNQGKLGLIEVNTNAGGAMLNALLSRAQRACCTAIDSLVPTLANVVSFEDDIVQMFRREWGLSGWSGTPEQPRPLRSIAIVDGSPKEQYLYPEFLLFQQLFERNGIRTVIADPGALEWRNGVLWHGEQAIDLVYNRLTDFYLEEPSSAALLEAYVQEAVVLTPHPQAHALYADKRRLALFSDADMMHALGVPETVQRILLEHIPPTELVKAEDAQRLWEARRHLFFKPVAGFGSRAAYRGDKLTKRVWQEILAGEYVAQAIVSPGERWIDSADPQTLDVFPGDPKAHRAMKFDLRAYAYGGDVQWVAARLYQGQTTNFRTPGGGFAPVYSTAETWERAFVTSDDEVVDQDKDSSYASFVFLLDSNDEVHPIPHGLYVALARGEATIEALAGQTLRLADWYVRLKEGAPYSVVNETYSLLLFDAQGHAKPKKAPPVQSAHGDLVENAAWPTAEERIRMNSLLFGEAASLKPTNSAAASGHCESTCSNGLTEPE